MELEKTNSYPAIYMDGHIYSCEDIEKLQEYDNTIYMLVDTGDKTYDLTFENREDKIIVFNYNLTNGETEIMDVIRKTKNPALSDNRNVFDNIERWIKETL
jgi:hypothetical protein